MDVVVFDLETTGLSPERDAIVEIAAVRLSEGVAQRSFETLVHPTTASGASRRIPARAQAIHGISDQMVVEAPTIAEVLPSFLEFVQGCAVVAHNLNFDASFIRVNAARLGLSWQPTVEICTMQLSRRAFPQAKAHGLGVLAERLGLCFAPGQRHRSLGDVEVTAQAYLQLCERIGQIHTPLR